jgi:hypothetical protein
VATETIQVEGYAQLMRAFARANKESRRYIRETLKEVGFAVQRDAVRRMSPISSKSAAGYKVSVRQRGVEVRQSLRKTTGRHPEFGALQMVRVLLPALADNEVRTEREMELALDRVSAHFNGGVA